MKSTTVVIQARMGSRRFRGKMLAALGGVSLIDWVILRVIQGRNPRSVVLATTTEAEDDALEGRAHSLGIEVVRGPVDDVLTRFALAAEKFDSDFYIRVCGDNPFVDSNCLRELEDSIAPEFDLIFNHAPQGDCTYADGLGGELISRELLRLLSARIGDPQLREHVTLAAYTGVVDCRIKGLVAPPELAHRHLRFDVNTVDDLKNLSSLVDSESLSVASSGCEIVAASLKSGIDSNRPNVR